MRAVVAGLALYTMLAAGCASVRTLTGYQAGDPVFLSGARLDVAAIQKNRAYLDKLRVEPPAWPWLDLPFSFTFDLFFWLLPRTPAPPPGDGR